MESKPKVGVEVGQERVENEIDTGRSARIPDWATGVHEHDTSLGVIRWNKEKYKDALFFSKRQIAGKRIGLNELLQSVKMENIQVLNINVLDFLLANKDQIPDEWKGKNIFFLGTIFNEKGGRQSVCYLEWDGSDWVSDHHWLDFELLARMPAVRLVEVI